MANSSLDPRRRWRGRGHGYLTSKLRRQRQHQCQRLARRRRLPATTPSVRPTPLQQRGRPGFQPVGLSGQGTSPFPFPPNATIQFLFLTSAEGPSHLHFNLTYANGTAEQRASCCPTTQQTPRRRHNISPSPPTVAKWETTGQMSERDHHTSTA